MRFEQEFRKAYPDTVGEKDREFDLSNYVEWLESLVEGVQTQTTNSTKPETVTPNHPCGLKGCASTSESISCEDCDQ